MIQEPSGGPCTIEQGTALAVSFGTAWSTVDDPFPQTRAQQLALAMAENRANVVGMTVSVDGARPVQIRTPRFELSSPQRTAWLAEDNYLEQPGRVPAQRITLTAHAWGAVIRKLSVGEHNVVVDVLFANGEHNPKPHLLTVVPKHGGRARTTIERRSGSALPKVRRKAGLLAGERASAAHSTALLSPKQRRG